jgi:PIN domain nuclease of toxin-antitoxin system
MSSDLLLDTHALLWLVVADPRAQDLLGDVLDQDASTVTVSTISYLEVAIKRATGKIDVDVSRVRRHVAALGLLELGITGNHAESLEQLPLHHRDPFDRTLIAQALAEDMAIATVDPAFADYEGLRLHGR